MKDLQRDQALHLLNQAQKSLRGAQAQLERSKDAQDPAHCKEVQIRVENLQLALTDIELREQQAAKQLQELNSKFDVDFSFRKMQIQAQLKQNERKIANA